MLALAIKARIPIIRATTTDLISLPDVLKVITPETSIGEWKGSAVSTSMPVVSYAVDEAEVTRDLYGALDERNKVLLLINHEASPYAFDAGEVPVPRALMEDLLENATTKKKVKELLPSFSGLTLKQMMEVVRLTETRDKALSAKGIMTTRVSLVGKLQGLAGVDTAMPLYLCPLTLKKWVNKNRPYFLEGKDERLVPRGLLLNGEPGVGKSAGAKYIATEYDVPLYRLALAAALTKWQGESEANLERILAALDQAEPAVLLIDEAEKLFAKSNDEGTTERMLAQLLWWLAEHRSRVLTVMTTNDLDALPAPLYRPGRIDDLITIPLLRSTQAYELAHDWAGQFLTLSSAQGRKLRTQLGRKEMSHAAAIKVASDFLKENQLV